MPGEDAATNVVDFMSLLQKSLAANKRTPARKSVARKAAGAAKAPKAAKAARPAGGKASKAAKKGARKAAARRTAS